MDERLQQIGKFLLVVFTIYAILHNPEFVGFALRAGWNFLRAFLDSLGRVLDSL